jgi:hypothetical protein
VDVGGKRRPVRKVRSCEVKADFVLADVDSHVY